MGKRSRLDAPHPALEIGDPLSFPERQAHAMQSELRLPTEFIPAAIDIVKGAFGEEWLRDRARIQLLADTLERQWHQVPVGV
jgi:hypothetical protein